MRATHRRERRLHRRAQDSPRIGRPWPRRRQELQSSSVIVLPTAHTGSFAHVGKPGQGRPRRCKSFATAPIFVAWSSITASIAPDRESSAMSKTILVTGGSRGIGRATCLLAAQRGWSVGVNYLKDKAAAQSAVAEVERSGAKAVAVAGDVSRESDVIAIFEATTK